MANMPKNIRQIGGREDRIKVYMEDYVSTYLRRVQQMQEEAGVVGLLTGCWEEKEQGASPSTDAACVFVSGAVMLEKADLEGGRVCLTQDAWTEGYEALGAYFSGQELCGIFVCEGSCRRFRRQALFAAVREAFPDREAMLYLLAEDGEEIFYRILPRGEERLQGYYCYFERNEAMQEYMMDHLPDRRVEWEMPVGRNRWRKDPSRSDLAEEGGSSRSDIGSSSYGQRYPGAGKEGTLGDPAEDFRQKMRRQQEERAKQKSGRGIVGLCAAMAVVIFVSGLGLVYRERGGIQISDLLNRLKIDPGRLSAVSAWPEETAEHYVASSEGQETEEEPGVGGSTQGGGSSVIVEEIPGNVFPTQGEAEGSAAVETTAAEPIGAETTAAETTAAEPEPSTEEYQTLPAEAGVIYVVKAGDSLYSISRRFYGTEAMASVIQELNGLENADLIKEGQELLLP